MSSEEVTVVCLRVAEATPHAVVRGSARERCVACRALVWLTPATRKAAGPTARLMCIPCWRAAGALGEVQSYTAEQVAEFRATVLS